MDTLDDKDMLLRKLVIYGFDCRSILFLRFELLCLYFIVYIRKDFVI